MPKLAILVVPKASRSEIVGWQGDVLKIRIAAPPVDGAANAELVKFLSKQLGVAKRAITNLSGETGRRKMLEIEGLDEVELAKKIPAR
ncbi:MAG: DUF167 domain-containing protein [Puniceicoccales bacterium]